MLRTLSLLGLAAVASTLRVAPLRMMCAQPPPEAAASSKALYATIDGVLRRARADESNRMSSQIARSLGNRWLEMSTEDLVEATLVSGNIVLEGFDEGLEILCEAEDNAALNISGKAYSALMRLAQSEERPVDALQLLARTRAYEVERTDGLLVSAMRAAAALEDWGGVARLYVELCDGPEAAALAAVELEMIAGDVKVMEAFKRDGGLAASPAASAAAVPTEAEMAAALRLALQAHCERGDVQRVAALLAQCSSRGLALQPAEYARLGRLAKRSPPADVQALVGALRPADVYRSLEELVEPQLLAAQGRLSVALASLGTVERAAAGVIVLAAALAVVGTVAGGFGGAAPDPADAALALLY